MHRTKPNILVILTDQHRFDTIAAAVDHFGVTTPALDELTRTGVSFDAACTTSPVCCPARSTIVTGLYPSQTGVYGNLTDEVGPMAEGIVTVANRMQEAGYQTVYHGKSHLGGRLENYGFEVAFENSHDPSTVTEACRFWRNADWIVNKRPFFHVVSLLNPHDIYFLRPGMEMEPTLPRWPNQDDDLSAKPWPQAVRRQEAWSDARWEYYRRFYASKVSKVDAQIDELLDELVCSGFGPNTWILFTADHGDMCGEHGLSFKGPFMYEGVTRVPLIIVPPRRAWGGAGNIDGEAGGFEPFRTDALVSHVDLVPTIMDIAGLPSDPALPGTSLLPILRREKTEVHDHVLAEWHCMGSLVTPIRMVRTKRYKYNLYLGIGEELYDLAA
ncbi:MAG: sulfatase-like hydrolase/transferase, partial [Planctomycetes bacterium]|nr:sulfatase-like hydrolase/transferase [Planctomycetota bacterium]